MAKKEKTSKDISTNQRAVVAKSDDGSIQITFTIPFEKIAKTRKQAIDEIGKNIEVPGFRKGKAPDEVLIKHIPENTLLEKTLSKILPKMVGQTIKEHKMRLATYPKFKLIKTEEGKAWEIRAETAEIPEFELGDYKKTISGALRAKTLWTPGKKGNEKTKDLSREAKEQEVIKTLIESTNLKIPKILVEEETNSRLSNLLQRLEKLGLSLESYLASINKKPGDIRIDYEKQARDSLVLDLILTRIADEKNISIDQAQIDAAIETAKADTKLAKELETEEKRRLIEAILRKRAALSFLTSLS